MSRIAKVLSATAILAAACSQDATPVASTVPPQPAQTAKSTPPAATPAMQSAPAAKPPEKPAAPPAAPPAAMMDKPQATPPTAPAPTAATPPAGTGGAAAMPPADPAKPADPAMPADAPAGAKQYTFDEIMMMKRDDLIQAWSDSPADKIWTGCSGQYKQLEHGSDGSPRDATPPIWMGKCIPEDTKILWNRGAGSTAEKPAELKESFIDKKVACIVTYSGGTELHFRNMGKDIWVGRQTQNGAASGVWYPLGMIAGDGKR